MTMRLVAPGVPTKGKAQARVISSVIEERFRQDEKWGPPEGRLPHGGSLGLGKHDREAVLRRDLEKLARRATEEEPTWENVLEEEVREACAALTAEELRAELVQVAAVAVAWVEALDAES
jgi:hypothetical protein